MHTPAVDRLVADVRAGLAGLADPDVAAGQQAYMKSAMPFRGVRAPDLRRAVRPLLDAQRLGTRAEWEAAVRELWDGAGFREERYAALRLAQHRHYRAHLDAAVLPLADHLVTTGAWWDLADDVAAHLVRPVVVAHRAGAGPVVLAWAGDADRWRRRTAVLSQLGAKGETSTDLLAAVLVANLADPDFFLRKAVGWALRDYARTDPDWVRGFLAEHAGRLSPLSVREASKHLGRRPRDGWGAWCEAGHAAS